MTGQYNETNIPTAEEVFDHLMATNTPHPHPLAPSLDGIYTYDIPDTPSTKEERIKAMNALRKLFEED